MSDIIAKLRRIRKNSGVSQEALAASLGMSVNSGPIISRLEKGDHVPLLSTVTSWADALGYELTLRPKE